MYLAIFLSFPSDVFLLDEPTSALDQQTAAELIGNIKDHCRKNDLTALVISHDRSIVDSFADKVIELERSGDR